MGIMTRMTSIEVTKKWNVLPIGIPRKEMISPITEIDSATAIRMISIVFHL